PLWQENGFHLTPVHFYSPVPDTRTLTDDLWSRDTELPGIDFNETVQLELLSNVFPLYRSEFEHFSRQPTPHKHEFYFDNGSFGGTDALALYCMVRHFRPRRIV